MKFTREDFFKMLELSLVLVVTLSMLVYGLAKYVQFGNGTLPDQLVSEMTGMELMWSFYGYSKTYPILLGIAEITGGLLFLIRRTRVIGGLFLSAILLNIITQDIIYEVNVGALKAAIIYQSLIAIVFWMNRVTLVDAIKAALIKNTSKNNIKKKVIITAAALLLAFGLKMMEVWLT